MKHLAVLLTTFFLAFVVPATQAYVVPAHPTGNRLPLHQLVRMVPSSGVACRQDSCDTLLPHTTDGGSNCVANITERFEVDLIDGHGLVEGKMYLFQSNTCDTYWATVKAVTTYMGGLTEDTVRTNTFDDPYSISASYNWPNYVQNQWLDGFMLGSDDSCSGGGQDEFKVTLHWQDRYGTWRYTGTGIADDCF